MRATPILTFVAEQVSALDAFSPYRRVSDVIPTFDLSNNLRCRLPLSFYSHSYSSHSARRVYPTARYGYRDAEFTLKVSPWALWAREVEIAASDATFHLFQVPVSIARWDRWTNT